MISGVGIDSVQVDRLKRAIERWGQNFLERLFTERELTYCMTHANPYPSLAARFAAKEALIKALKVKGAWKWRDMEVERAESGEPSILLKGEAAAYAASRGRLDFHISLTHDHGRATAVVIVLGEGR